MLPRSCHGNHVNNDYFRLLCMIATVNYDYNSYNGEKYNNIVGNSVILTCLSSESPIKKLVKTNHNIEEDWLHI